ncbi:MAG TPA: PQQ-binding-like beta-propeller repeat protein, partial [Pirellulales bacterium]
GQLAWKKDLYREFQVRDKPDWGTCSSPLVVDGKLIVNPGGREAALVALDPATGEIVWKAPGRKAAYGSFIAVAHADRTELVGYDATSLGGWDAATGRRLWSVVPPQPHDFNVPTPLLAPAAGPGEKLLVVSTENNGTRAYRFSSDGTLASRPVAECPELAPDSQTPVVLDVRASRDDRPRPRLFGVWQGLHCLDLRADHLLRPIWTAADPAFDNYAVVIGCGNRILIVANTGEFLLVDAAADAYRLISRLKVFEDDEGVYAHPALVGTRLYLRGSDEVVCLELGS